MRSTRNKEFITELRQYIDDNVQCDDVASDSLKDRFTAWKECYLVPWTEGQNKNHFKPPFNLLVFIDFERGNLDFDYYFDEQERLVKQWLQIEKLSRYMLRNGVEYQFYFLIFPVFNTMLKENTGKDFEETILEVIEK